MPPKPKEISDGWRGDDSFQLVLRAGQDPRQLVLSVAGQVLQVATGWGWGREQCNEDPMTGVCFETGL